MTKDEIKLLVGRLFHKWNSHGFRKSESELFEEAWNEQENTKIELCEECGCKLAREIWGLEFHKPNCSNFPF